MSSAATQVRACGRSVAKAFPNSLRQFIEKTAAALGMRLRWEGAGVAEVGYWLNSNAQCPPQPIVKIDPRYFRPTEVETLLGDAGKAKQKLGWVPEITLNDMITEMVTSDMAQATQHALLKQHGFAIPVSAE